MSDDDNTWIYRQQPKLPETPPDIVAKRVAIENAFAELESSLSELLPSTDESTASIMASTRLREALHWTREAVSGNEPFFPGN